MRAILTRLRRDRRGIADSRSPSRIPKSSARYGIGNWESHHGVLSTRPPRGEATEVETKGGATSRMIDSRGGELPMQETGLSKVQRAWIATLLVGAVTLAGYGCLRHWPVTTTTI